MKKILTIEDLVIFCERGKFTRFNSSESGYSLRVRMPVTFSKQESDDYTLYGKVKIMHTGRNRNRSNLTLDAMNKCKDRLAYKPLLANFCEIEGVKDFTSHDFSVDEDGNLEYQEFPIGCFTNDEPEVKYEQEKDRYYLYAYCAIPREYTDAAEIIERKGGTKVSAELAINEMSYDSKEKELILEDVEVVGVTCLGTDPETGEEVEEGMEGAKLEISDFSANKEVLSTYDIKLLKEMLNKYKNVESFTLQKGEDRMENEQLSLELENQEDETPETTEEVTEETTEENESTEETEETTEDETAPSEDTEESAPAVEANAEFSAKLGEQIYTFKTSLQDELYALTQLVNDTYAESDNAYYMVDAYADTKEVIMVDYWSGKAYKQSYKVKNGVYSLKGDRVSVHARYITDDEEKALDEMKSNYSVISEKLQKYEDEPKKMEILNSSEYGFVAAVDEFLKLKEQKNHFDLSIDDTKKKADEILLSAVKNTQFSVTPESNQVGCIHTPPKKTVTGRYGGIFKK